MAPPSKPSRRGVGSRLTAKVGPLPVWAWAAVILGAYLLWTRTRGAAAAPSPDATATPDSSGDSGAQVPASGGGSAADNVSAGLLDRLDANTSALDALTLQILSQPTPYSDYGDGPLSGAPADDSGRTSNPSDGGGGPAAGPAPAPASKPTPRTTGHGATQTAAGSLRWGGLTFTTRAGFDRWAKAHGTTASRELRKHPQAKAIYSTLR